MPSIGLTLTNDRAARWLEAHPSQVDCVEISTRGFYARPTPYLAWLASQWPLVLRVPLTSEGFPQRGTNSALPALPGEPACPHRIVAPLALHRVGGTQLRVPIAPANTPAVRAQLVSDLRPDGPDSIPTLVEPVTSWPTPGVHEEAPFLTALCEAAECRLLVDVATVLIAGRTRQFNPVEWLEAIPADLIAAVRIGGTSAREGRWRHDPTAAIDPAAWQLLAILLTQANPDVILLEPRDTPSDVEALEQDLARLPKAASREHVVVANAEYLEVVETGTSRAREDPPRGPARIGQGVGVRFDRAIAPDVSLFVLDREGVVLFEPRREITLFNTAATFVWCLLEDGNGPDAIVREYADTFGIPSDEAERHVGSILGHWFGRGYITAPAALPAHPTPLMTALAWLVTNPRLRALFHQDPAGLADTLGMTGEERDLLLALDHEELDAQAADEDEALALEMGADEPTRAPQPAIVGEKTGVERRYRLLTTTVAIHAPANAPLQHLGEALGHLEAPGSTPEVQVELRSNGSSRWPDGWQLFENAELVTELPNDAFIVPAVKQLLRERAVERHPFFMSVHAGVVAFGDDCVLLPALAGSGKTTLTAALVNAGATYFSDEIALLDGPTMAVTPVPLALTIKDGSLEPLRSRYPVLEGLPPHIREDYVRVRYMPPPAFSLPGPGATARARWIVFPTYSPNAATTLRAIDRPTALRRLLDESTIPPRRMTREHIESLVQWMRTVDCYELPFSNLETAVSLIASLATSQPD